jgi:hypothetical protein
MITAEQLVNREVHYCVSALVSQLACGEAGRGLADLADQAFELCSPIDDYEEAAIQEGWQLDQSAPVTGSVFKRDHGETFNAASWQEACELDGIEPYQREVFEHWIVSDWLADKLAEKGEKVDKDFAGLTVWARTTTGQGIASDSVIEAILADLAKGA